ncbi:Mct1p [Blomia tropicalis]|nr:Mct1p [Blomia tropicalis]
MAVTGRNTRKSKSYPICPDGGWGWMVVFGSFMIHVIADGVIYSFGLFYFELARHFGASKAVTSMVVSLMNGMTYCIGPIASALTIKYGCRTVTIVGAICTSMGLFLSVFVPNVYVLYLTIGICSGFGFGLMYLPAIVIVTSYFEKKRAFATGIAVCGSGIGTAIMSPLIEYMIKQFGWKGAMLVTSGLILKCCIFGLLFRPLPNVTDDRSINDPEATSNTYDLVDETKEMISEKSELNGQLITTDDVEDDGDEQLDQFSLDQVDITQSAPRLSMPHNDHDRKGNCKSAKSMHSVQLYLNDVPMSMSNVNNETKIRSQSFTPGFLYRKDTFYSGNENVANNGKNNKKPNSLKNCFLFRWLNCSEDIIETFSEMIDLSLMRNYIFLIFSISNFLTSVGYHIPFIYLKDRIVELNVALPEEAGFFTAIIGVASTISRLVFGYLADHSFVNRLWLYIISVTFCGLVIMANSFITSYQLMAIFCTLFGVTCGTYVSLTSVVLVDLLGLEKLTNAFGLILLFQGVASIVGPPFIGCLYDVYGNHDIGFYIIGAIVAFSGLMLILIDFAHYFKSIKKMLMFPN